MSEGKQLAQKEKKRKKKKGVNIKLIALSFLVIFVLIGFILVGFMGVVLVQNYEIDESKLDMQEATIIYDRNGNEISKLFIENRKYIPIEEVPEQLKDAFVAIEDQRFNDHQGIDFRAIGRALYRDILARSMVEGGSTITQQLAKNAFLTQDKKLMRKTEEVLIALKLEQRYSKEAILEMYLNYINFGHGAHGIQAAAQVYFAKDADQLELGEIAMLAALPKAPNHYSPIREGNEERSENRRQLVLRVMEEQGKITAAEREEAANTPLVLNEKGVTSNPALFTYVDMVMDEAEKKYDISSDELLVGGYKIYTALDLKAQEAMFEAFDQESEVSKELFPEPGSEHIVQGSMVIIDHQTGAVVAVTGGRDYVRRGLNRAVSDARQTGSTFKPISVYAPALESNWEPYDILQDKFIDYGGYKPRNYDGKYQGKVTMMEAVRRSYNAPAVWLLNEVGISTGMSYAEAFGFENVERKLGIALGDVGGSPLQMASAFGTFANHGLQMEPYLIEKIVDKDDYVIATNEPKYTQIVTEQTAWYMTKMLEGVVQSGTGTRAKLKHPVAGKTGTTQTPGDYKGVRDAWFVGYTPQYVASVWMGFDQLDKEHVMDTSGGNHPARIFKHVMEKALADVPIQSFQRPQGVKELEEPIRLQPIQDLRGFITLQADMSITVELEFTPMEDERVAYQIFRIEGESGEQELLATLTKEQLAEGGRWSDPNVKLGNSYQYEVVPLNMRTGAEGEASNRITMKVVPSSPLFRKSEEIDNDEFIKWLMEQEEGFNERDNEMDSEENEEKEEDEEPRHQDEKREKERKKDKEKENDDDQEEKNPEDDSSVIDPNRIEIPQN